MSKMDGRDGSASEKNTYRQRGAGGRGGNERGEKGGGRILDGGFEGEGKPPIALSFCPIS
jgi:hypothetical protein